MKKQFSKFIWDARKERDNISKHKIDFTKALRVFLDPKRKIFIDSKHSEKEERYFCIGKVDDKIVTVRFTYRSNKIRIIGAGYWRKGGKYYEEKS
ncbi:hypothetical protein AUJ66_06425 [Candidatus Desantisbacteria bacterium CG1_02_38_46]|uniref:BrnT family toxin n=3 Tax=unclassified Candidatus Desantisiibacteriota TaxID=3106372 RepID=A0A2H9PED9_9BACT|nr:MAG: hypothetical protein AUJ66_06425 [Candidatus Desantisbacteria bacterium CG1_02_38_46]PIU51511.1 MAG: hypothetical protein COS91_04055 [Candidatus Desantisbacteria bacterium CG07_land_8_20_14_0_80_39_15]PIZ17176.1 MAG: hypothetical protein COY51_00930 [Candidatus Desantisbacteria bacterium CG_4_10_14_0_8_um_filter_39_17]